jgi:hypothetical protein
MRAACGRLTRECSSNETVHRIQQIGRDTPARSCPVSLRAVAGGEGVSDGEQGIIRCLSANTMKSAAGMLRIIQQRVCVFCTLVVGSIAASRISCATGSSKPALGRTWNCSGDNRSLAGLCLGTVSSPAYLNRNHACTRPNNTGCESAMFGTEAEALT